MKTILVSFTAAVAISGLFSTAAAAAEPIDIGGRLELLVDDYVLDKLDGARLTLHKPVGKEVVLTTDKPWEGNTCAYYTIFQDGPIYRMYYRGSHADLKAKKSLHPEVVCYAESQDGIYWTKPELGLIEYEGSKQNNIVWNGIGTHCFTPFIDANPNCPAEARYKAIAGGRPLGKAGLYVFASPDGLRWKLLHNEPVITNGAFDSQNLAFWDPHRKLYVDYHRKLRDRRRDIMTCTSKDFLTWTEPKFLEYTGAPKQHLYTNAIRSYARAPHILIGFPTRYLPKTQQVEPTFMTSRDGMNFHRWNEALIPITAPEDRDGNRSNYMTWGLVQLPGNDREYSVYATEAYYEGPDSRVRRFTYRVDGFVSARAPASGGELISKPIRFTGKKLVINSRTSEAGSLKVEIQDAAGAPIERFSLADCTDLRGDEIAQTVRWQSNPDLAALAGKPIRLRFVLKDADLFSFQFQE